MSDTLKGKTDIAKEKLNSLKDAALNIKDAGFEKIKSYTDKLSGVMPLLEKAGFKAESVKIELGLIPDILLEFSKEHQIDTLQIEALIEQNQDKKLLVNILNTLLSVNNIQSKINFKRLNFSGIEIKLGIHPKVTIIYK